MPHDVDKRDAAAKAVIQPLNSVRVHQDLATAALIQRKERLLVLWSLLRALCPGGSGCVDKMAAREWLDLNCGMSHSSFYTTLRRGRDEGWWSETRSRRDGRLVLHPANLKTVSLLLGVVYFARGCVDVPVTDLHGGCVAVRKTLYATQHAIRKSYALQGGHIVASTHIPNPISRIAIKNKTGRCERTQRKYERKAGIDKHANIVVHPDIPPVPAGYRPGKDEARRGQRVVRINGENRIGYQAANTYIAGQYIQHMFCQRRALNQSGATGLTEGGPRNNRKEWYQNVRQYRRRAGRNTLGGPVKLYEEMDRDGVFIWTRMEQA